MCEAHRALYVRYIRTHHYYYYYYISNQSEDTINNSFYEEDFACLAVANQLKLKYRSDYSCKPVNVE